MSTDRTALFAARDFICEGEQDEYDRTRAALMDTLNPSSPLEEIFALEIVSATWRLRRCRIIESCLALNPNVEQVHNEQKSVDRARAQSHNLVRRSLAELRKLQTERQIRLSLELKDNGSIVDARQVLAAIATGERRRKAAQNGELRQFEAQLRQELGMPPLPGAPPPSATNASSFCKNDESSCCGFDPGIPFPSPVCATEAPFTGQ